MNFPVSASKQASSKKQHSMTAGSEERELRAQLRVRPSQCPKDKPYVDCSIVSPCKGLWRFCPVSLVDAQEEILENILQGFVLLILLKVCLK